VGRVRRRPDHLKVRLEADKVCLLVIIGVRADGRKELVALADGFRESSESWADLVRDCKRRGMTAPALAVGDGALGFWKAVRDVFPVTAEQRCWWHYADLLTMPTLMLDPLCDRGFPLARSA
jgi:transposase-like protein